MIPRDIRHALHQHARKGGKTARRRQVKRAEEFVDWCGCNPYQTGRGHVRRYFRAKGFAPSTARDHWYAIRLLWRVMGRPGEPPKPPPTGSE